MYNWLQKEKKTIKYFLPIIIKHEPKDEKIFFFSLTKLYFYKTSSSKIVHNICLIVAVNVFFAKRLRPLTYVAHNKIMMNINISHIIITY